jgi:hypothetical protein
MKNMRITPWYIAIIIIFVVSLCFPLQAKAGGTVGDGTPESCTEAALDTALAGGGLVTFNCGPGMLTIPITSQKMINEDTEIDGGQLISISGSGITRHFQVPAGSSLVIKNLQLTNGNNILGGSILNDGSLSLKEVAVLNNQAPGGSAGGIYNTGTLAINHSYLTGNIASAGLGGAIYNTGVVTISHSQLSSNFGGLEGGAIINRETGNVTISSSTVFSNTAYHGGGISSGGGLIIDTSIFMSNSTIGGFGGAIYNSGSMKVTLSDFSSNYTAVGKEGGAIYNNGSARINTSRFYNNSVPGGLGGGISNHGLLTIVADTFSANSTSAGLGGGIYSLTAELVNITNSTFSENFGGLAGGGLLVNGPANILNTTFFGNTPDGVSSSGPVPVTMKNTILAGNSPANCSGSITSLGYNLDDGESCALSGPGDQSSIDPQLGPLADNGGPTWTHALLPDSPAINAGTNEGCPSSDQRGVIRPLLGTCDTGAYEFGFVIQLPVVRK